MRFWVVIIAVLLVGCGADGTKPTVKKESRYKGLLARFPVKSFDTLRVYSSGDSSGEYAGAAIDSANARLFPKEIAEAALNDWPGLFAVYQFPIDKRFTGLLARTPSMYYPTSIKLFIYDGKLDTIADYTELAEVWGDAGDALTRTSWLTNDKNKVKAFVWYEESHDHSVEEETDTTVERSEFLYELDLSKGRVDTVNADQVKLRGVYGGWMK